MKTRQLFFVTIMSLLAGVLQSFVLQAESNQALPQPTAYQPASSQPAPLQPVPVLSLPPSPPPLPVSTVAPIVKPEYSLNDSLNKLREIYVPANEIGVIFESAKNSLLIKRSEFEKLRKQAREVLLELDRDKTKTRSPVDAVLLASDYKISVADLRAVIEGELEIEVLTDDIVAIPFSLDRVSVIEAINIETKKPAALEIHNEPPQTSAGKQTGLLVLQGKKQHKIKIVATTPLEIDSTRQRIAFNLPYGAKNSMRLMISGDVELKNGASVISRKIEEHAGENNTKLLTTQFELLPPAGNRQTDLTMSLNSHRASTYQAVLARSIQFAEVTEQYERLHATVSLTEMHQGIAEAVFEIPAGFEITDVASVLLDKWNVEKGKKNTNEIQPDRLKLKFREQLPGLTTIYLSAIKVSQLSREKSVDWQFPIFNPVNVAANSVVLGLLVEQELEMTDLVSNKLYPIDPLTLQSAIPPSALNTVPGSPLIRLASAWYAPRDQFSVKSNFKRPKTDCKVESREILLLADKTPTLQIDYTITARTGKIFETIIETPTDWKISSIITDSKKTLEFREVNTNKTSTDKRQFAVQFPYGIIPGETFRFSLFATGTVEGWFTVDSEKKISYPLFNIVNTTNAQGKIGIQFGGETDWEVVPAADENLIPLDDSVKQNLFPVALPSNPNQPVPAHIGLAEQSIKTVLAYEYLTKPFNLALKLEKLQPRLNVKSASIYSFTPTLLHVNHELWFTAKHASTQRLSFLLPIATPNTVSIEKINDHFVSSANVDGNNHQPNTRLIPIHTTYKQSEIKETFSSEVEVDGKKYRRWEVLLSKPQSGLLKLNVNFDIPIERDKNTNNNNAPQPFKLPVIIAENVAWQSDIFAIQGDEELDIQILTDTNKKELLETANTIGKVNVLRSIDVGTIAGMHHQPGKRLIGVYSVVQDNGDVVVMMQRNKLLPLVTAVIKNVTIIAQLGDSAESGTIYSVLYDICTEGVSVKLTLGGNDEIWSVKLDGQTIKPQRVGNDILIPIQQQLKNNTQTNQQSIQKSNNLRRIELVYHNRNNPLKNVRLSFPSLSVKKAEGNVVIPVMQTKWEVIPPTGYTVTKIGDAAINISDKFNPAVFQIFNVGTKIISTVAYKESDWSQYFEWLPTFEINWNILNKADVAMQTAPNVDVSGREFPSNSNSRESDVSMVCANDNGESASAPSSTPRSTPPLMADSKTAISEVSEMANFSSKTNNDDKKTKLSNSLQITKQQIRRLKTVQPVTVVINHDLNVGANYSLIGTKNIQEVSVKLANSVNRVILGWISYLVVLFVGLLFIKSNYSRKVRFVFGVFIVGTVLVFIPYFDTLATILNAAVYSSLTVAVIFIISAIIKIFYSYYKLQDSRS
ncbi:MAG: hypothetical protein LBC74_11665 [Planctomycetaceae bacterium]|nr:hypothetical protein [Planctomycetaceae bacterium]